MIGKSPGTKLILDRIRRFAPLPWPVVLLGETGTGKELAARTVHRKSPRRHHPFIATNVTAIPEALFESELFGHARGAFTGAHNSRTGLLEAAEGGTLFLDEINSLAPHMQEKLLRVLQEKEIRKVGSNLTLPVDVRFITATNQDLGALCKEGKFRQDLYHRLHVLPIHLPPLRDREEDLPLFVAHLPGNIRELENSLRYAVAIAESEDLPEQLFAFLEKGTPRACVPRLMSIEEYSRRALLEWGSELSRKELASRLGISRKTLWEMRKRWGIA